MMKGKRTLENNLIMEFQVNLLEWYDKSARHLPWREFSTPYKVWISEIMLQQTRVEAVKPYFEKFMLEVPDVQTLADIAEEKLLKLWEGLGYYSRARNMKKAAQVIVEKYNCKIPDTVQVLRSLPGIGPYTSGAIASIAYGVKAPAIDGNVLRIISRVNASREDVTNQKVKAKIEELVIKLLPEERVGDFNQALMDLGAMICLPTGIPKCETCPLCSQCEGYQQGIAEKLPVKKKKTPRKIEIKTVLVIICQGKIALRKRPEDGLLANLWEFPHIEGALSRKDCFEIGREWELSIDRVIPLPESKHIFTHLEWKMFGNIIYANNQGNRTDLVWVAPQEIQSKYAIPNAFKPYLREVEQMKL